MIVLIILNILLIAILTFLIIYFLRNKKDGVKNVCVNDVIKDDDRKENDVNPERVFIGRFVTDEEYNQMVKNRKSDISILLEDLDNEYEHLKELSK